MVTANKFSPVSYGMRQGVKISLILIGIYFTIGLLIEVGRQIWLTHNSMIMTLPFVKVAGYLPFYFLILIYPVVVLGSLTGGIIGEFWTRFGYRLNRQVFTLTGFVFCVSFVIGFHLIFGIRVDFSIPALQLDTNGLYMDTLGFLVSYPFQLGIPSILYVLLGGLGSYFFWIVCKNRIEFTEHIN